MEDAFEATLPSSRFLLLLFRFPSFFFFMLSSESLRGSMEDSLEFFLLILLFAASSTACTFEGRGGGVGTGLIVGRSVFLHIVCVGFRCWPTRNYENLRNEDTEEKCERVNGSFQFSRNTIGLRSM